MRFGARRASLTFGAVAMAVAQVATLLLLALYQLGLTECSRPRQRDVAGCGRRHCRNPSGARFGEHPPVRRPARPTDGVPPPRLAGSGRTRPRCPLALARAVAPGLVRRPATPPVRRGPFPESRGRESGARSHGLWRRDP